MTSSNPQSQTISVQKLELEGAYNFRDLGGTPAGAGRKISDRRIYRADALNALTEADIAVLRERQLGHVIDLREDRERAGHPDATERLGIRHTHIPIFQNELFAEDGRMTQHTDEQYANLMGRYSGQVASAAASVIRSEHPVVVHCTAGKDRTGIVVGVLLRILGTPLDHIQQDYALSRILLLSDPRFWSRVASDYTAAGISTAALEESKMPQPSTLVSDVLQGLEVKFGTIEDFLASHGIAPKEMEAFVSASTENV